MSEELETTEEIRAGYAFNRYSIEAAHGEFDRWYAEEIRKAKGEVVALVRSEIRQIPRWWNSELGYGEFDLQPLGPNETSEKGAYMEVMRVLDECAGEYRKEKND